MIKFDCLVSEIYSILQSVYDADAMDGQTQNYFMPLLRRGKNGKYSI